MWDVKPNQKSQLEKICLQLGQLRGQERALTQRTMAVSLVPVTGLLRIFSGNFGDACYTSQYDQLAGSADLLDVHAWVHVTNRGKPKETMAGSLLGIEALSVQDNIPTLMARAHNPQENLIQSVDEAALVVGSLREVVNTARRLCNQRMAQDPVNANTRQYVVVPFDKATASSTNRPGVRAVYEKMFKDCNKIALHKTAATEFNGYTNYDASGSNACVLIWEIDAAGNEIWHGNWPQQEQEDVVVGVTNQQVAA